MSSGSEHTVRKLPDLSVLSRKYAVRVLGEADAGAVFALCRENRLYYEYCPPFVTPESVRADMHALPPGKGPEDKYYCGFFDGERIKTRTASYTDFGTAVRFVVSSGG